MSALDEGDGEGWETAGTFSENRGGELMSTAIGRDVTMYHTVRKAVSR